MKNKIMTLIGIAALMLAMEVNASQVLLNGAAVTNRNVIYNAATTATNAAGAITNNYQNGVVPGASNVFYTLSTTLGAQPYSGTNSLLPALVLSAEGSYPGSLNAPVRYIGVEISGSLMATNASATSIVFQLAASDSGLVWSTNYKTYTLAIPVNSTTLTASNCIFDTFDSGGHGYIALQQINNPGAAALTNIVICIVGKPGM